MRITFAFPGKLSTFISYSYILEKSPTEGLLEILHLGNGQSTIPWSSEGDTPLLSFRIFEMRLIAHIVIATVLSFFVFEETCFCSNEGAANPPPKREHVELVQEADLLSKRGSQARAIEMYTELISLNPLHMELWYKRAWAHLRSKDYELAIKDFTECVNLSPDAHWGYTGRGLTYISNGSINRAVDEFSKAIHFDPTVGPLYKLRGDAYVNLKQWSLAFSDFSKAEKLGVDDQELYHNRGLALHGMGKFQEALPDLTRTIATDPNNVMNYENRAVAYFSLGKGDEALRDIEKASKLGRTSYRSIYLKGLILAGKEDYVSALDVFREVHETAPTEIVPVSFIGIIEYYGNRDYGKGIEYVKKAVKLAPETNEIVAVLITMISTCPDPRYNDATLALDLAGNLESDDKDLEFYYLGVQASAYAINGLYEEAIKTQRKVLSYLQSENANPELIKEYEAELAEYEAGRPHVEKNDEQTIKQMFNSF